MSAGIMRRFSDTIRHLADGETDQRLTEAMNRLVRTLRENGGGKGKIVLSVELELDRGTIELTDAVKITEPAAPKGRTIFWPTEHGDLSVYDPRQTRLGLRDASDDDRRLRADG